METDNYKPNRYAQRHPKAVVRPFFAAILRSPFIVQPMMSAVNLPDCRVNLNCLLELREKWKSVMPDDIKAMIADGADVNAWGYSAVCAGQSYQNVEGVRIPIDLINPNGGEKANVRAYTPLHWAAYFGNVEVIPVLVEAGASVNGQTERGFTPLHTAARFDKSEVIRVLTDNNADLEAGDYNNDWTPLHIAVIQKAKKAIPTLIKVGADKTAKDKNGRTPLDLAKEIKDEIMKRKIVNLLGDTA